MYRALKYMFILLTVVGLLTPYISTVVAQQQMDLFILRSLNTTEIEKIISTFYGKSFDSETKEGRYTVYTVKHDIKVYSDGYGAFWVKSSRRYTVYKNVNSTVIDNVIEKLRTLLTTITGKTIKVEVVGVNDYGIKETIGGIGIRKTENGTVTEELGGSRIVYAKRIDLLYRINEYSFIVNPYIVVDFYGDIIGGGFLIPAIDKTIKVNTPDPSVVNDKIITHLRSSYGEPKSYNMSSLGYIYASPSTYGTDKAYLSPGYMMLSMYNGGDVRTYYLVTEKGEKIVEGTRNMIYGPGFQESSNITGSENNTLILDIAIIATAIAIVSTVVLYFKKFR